MIRTLIYLTAGHHAFNNRRYEKSLKVYDKIFKKKILNNDLSILKIARRAAKSAIEIGDVSQAQFYLNKLVELSEKSTDLNFDTKAYVGLYAELIGKAENIKVGKTRYESFVKEDVNSDVMSEFGWLSETSNYS